MRVRVLRNHSTCGVQVQPKTAMHGEAVGRSVRGPLDSEIHDGLDVVAEPAVVRHDDGGAVDQNFGVLRHPNYAIAGLEFPATFAEEITSHATNVIVGPGATDCIHG